MESPRKFNDCYFYYYSTCTKGDSCVFRHEPSALGCETMCSAWQQGKCTDTKCKLRHMELRKNRKQIPCYWETQPGGCRKKHCPFMHTNPDARTDGIAPSQPAPIINAQESSSGPEPIVESGMMRPNVLAASAGPPPVPVAVLLQQQRQQVVLDSAILGVLPGSSELARRVVHSHAHAHAHPHAHAHAHAHAHDPSAYAMPVDPLVVNFEEESDNESAPSSTPTKNVNQDYSTRTCPNKNPELELLEKIQAESAAYYSYDPLAPVEIHKAHKLVRTNLNAKYDKLSLDEIAGKKLEAVTRSSLDFKVLSLDEIRAKKKVSEATILKTPITLNMTRKRKLSTHETITTSGNKILKVVRKNSLVYKQLDKNAQAQPSLAKPEQKRVQETDNRKRTLSEVGDLYDLDDELVDDCYEFKRIKIAGQIPKPRLVRNGSATKSTGDSKENYETDMQLGGIDASVMNDEDIIYVDSTKMGDPVDVVDLCDQDDNASDVDLDLVKNVPDVVASCQKYVQTTLLDEEL